MLKKWLKKREQKMLDLAKAVDENVECLKRARTLFPEIKEEEIKAIHDDDVHYLQFGENWILTPTKGEKETFNIKGRVTVECLKWNLMTFKVIPGSFNPYDGGYPDDVEEVDCGDFNTVWDCLIHIKKLEAENSVLVIAESYDYEKMERDAEEYNQPYEPQLCPHGKEWHECNACLIRSDQEYDAMIAFRR